MRGGGRGGSSARERRASTSWLPCGRGGGGIKASTCASRIKTSFCRGWSFDFFCSSCWPFCTARQSEQGCLPSKVEATASVSGIVWEKRASIVVHARPWRSTQCPPRETTSVIATSHCANRFMRQGVPSTASRNNVSRWETRTSNAQSAHRPILSRETPRFDFRTAACRPHRKPRVKRWFISDAMVSSGLFMFWVK